MKCRWILSIALVLSSVHTQASMWDKIPTETGNYCKDQARGFIRYLFGDDIKFYSTATSQCSGPAGCDINMWMEVDFCDGYLVATYAPYIMCSHPHYGSMPLYIKRLWAYGECKNFLPRDKYPTKETTFPYIHSK